MILILINVQVVNHDRRECFSLFLCNIHQFPIASSCVGSAIMRGSDSFPYLECVMFPLWEENVSYQSMQYFTLVNRTFTGWPVDAPYPESSKIPGKNVGNSMNEVVESRTDP